MNFIDESVRMRRKSERTASKKAKASPEVKVEKAKKTRTRRRKQSSSSENDSPDEASPVRVAEPVAEEERKPPQTPAKEENVDESPDQVWQVKTAEGSGDGGEIQKLKICLTRPPSTPERAERSPRQKRKHSRATSSSDNPSDTSEEKKKNKHRSKRSFRDKDGTDKNQDSQEEDQDAENEDKEKSDHEVSQSETEAKVETSVSTTNKENKSIEESSEDASSSIKSSNVVEICASVQDDPVADTTVGSPRPETNASLNIDSVSAAAAETTEVNNENTDECINDEKTEITNEEKTVETTNAESVTENNESTLDTLKDETVLIEKEETTVATTKDTSQTEINETESNDNKSTSRERSDSVDKSEVLELHPEESKMEIQDLEISKSKDIETSEELEVTVDHNAEVSIKKGQTDSNEPETNTGNAKVINESDVVEKSRKTSTDSGQSNEVTKCNNGKYSSNNNSSNRKDLGQSDETTTSQSEIVPNGQIVPIVVNRKRKWGSRPSKLTTQKSITISTDVLKDIIPNVKPVEFDEVIEEKKHKRIEVKEKIDRPVLPKIVIDNSENVEQKKKDERKENDKDKENVKLKEMNSNRKISIIKEKDSIIARPPSPPRHKQSNILFITNLVRPFTLLQLKNLLQRTGRIEENGFWIDKIKSKCYVKYETEDQAVETRHALHGVTWPVSNPKTLHVDFSTTEAFDKALSSEEAESAPPSAIPGTVEDWLREQDLKREAEVEKSWERKGTMREWDVGKNDKDKERDKLRREDRPSEKRRHRTPERSPEPARKFKKKEEEAPAKLLDDLFRKTKTTPCIYWLPLSAETIAIKEEQRRQHMAEYERRLLEQRRPPPHRRH